jgi:hypothetical protein
VALMLETVLVREARQHSLQPLVGELHHPATALANQVLVICLLRHWLVTLEPFPEVVRPHQAALDKELQCTVNRCRADPLTLLPQLSADTFDRQMIRGKKDNLSH